MIEKSPPEQWMANAESGELPNPPPHIGAIQSTYNSTGCFAS